MNFLQGLNVVNLAVNLPGPAAARRLAHMGAKVIKVEPPSGDPMVGYCPQWYREMVSTQKVVRLNLRLAPDRTRLDNFLAEADLLLTAMRPAALEALGLSWNTLHQEFPRLCQVAIVGFPAPRENQAGHDLTYRARLGLLQPPHLPRALLADMAGADRIVQTALGLLLARERFCHSDCVQVALSEAAADLAEPLRFNLTAPGGLLGGGSPQYNLYRTKDGWVAVAALEPHFRERLEQLVGGGLTIERCREVFAGKTTGEWEQCGRDQDIPIVGFAGGEPAPL